MTKKYDSFIKDAKDSFPFKNREVSPRLTPGFYNVNTDPQSGQFWFSSIAFNFDEIIDIPSTEYKLVVDQMDTFLKPETKENFTDYGFLYKRSALLHGKPGTGKTTIINRVGMDVVKKGGVVLFNPSPMVLHSVFEVLEDTQPDTLLMVIFEELDELLKGSEGILLSLLDGEIQKDGILYIATTNFIEKIPDRIKRPGRFSNVIEVGLPNEECRYMYINTKLENDIETKELTAKTDGLTIDEIKEVILSNKCLGMSIDDTITRIKKNKERFTIEEVDEEELHALNAYSKKQKNVRGGIMKLSYEMGKDRYGL